MVADNWTGPLETRIDMLLYNELGAPLSVHGFHSMIKLVANDMAFVVLLRG